MTGKRTEVSIHTALCCDPHSVFPQVGRVMGMYNAKLATAKCSTYSPLMGAQAPSWGCWSSLKMHLESCSTEPESTNTATCFRHHFRGMEVICSLYCV